MSSDDIYYEAVAMGLARVIANNDTPTPEALSQAVALIKASSVHFSSANPPSQADMDKASRASRTIDRIFIDTTVRLLWLMDKEEGGKCRDEFDLLRFAQRKIEELKNKKETRNKPPGPDTLALYRRAEELRKPVRGKARTWAEVWKKMREDMRTMRTKNGETVKVPRWGRKTDEGFEKAYNRAKKYYEQQAPRPPR